MPTCMHDSLIVLALIFLYGGHCFIICMAAIKGHTQVSHITSGFLHHVRHHASRILHHIIMHPQHIKIYPNSVIIA